MKEEFPFATFVSKNFKDKKINEIFGQGIIPGIVTTKINTRREMETKEVNMLMLKTITMKQRRRILYLKLKSNISSNQLAHFS